VISKKHCLDSVSRQDRFLLSTHFSLSLDRPPPINKSPIIGFVVSKKVHKRAVVRNRLKRQFREIFRHWLLHASQSSSLSAYRSLVVIVRASSVGVDYQTLEKALSRALRIPKACAS
jgi:ribonuclease P protein component